MAYPTYGQSIESTQEDYDDLQKDRTFAGILKTRSLVPVANIKKIFNVVHPYLTLTEKTALMSYYTTNRDATFSFTWKADNVAYNVKFTSIPKITIVGGNWWRGVVTLEEV